jgi:hypothetical protein
MSVAKLLKDLQLLARRNPPGKTKLEMQDTLAVLRERIHDQFDGQVLEFSTRIINLDWSPEAATIQIQSPVPKHRPSKAMPFVLTAVPTHVIPMSRETAMAISSRKPMRFRGRLKFIDHDFSSVRLPTRSLFSVRSADYKLVATVGVFVTEDYSVSIGDDEILRIQPTTDDPVDQDAGE